MGEFPAQTKGFTPVLDVIVAEVGLVAAVVYGAVWRYCQMGDGVCRASLETIAARVGLDRRTVLRHIKALCSAGYLRDLTPDERARPHIYAHTGKATLKGVVEVGQKEEPSEAPGVTESHPRSDSESPPGVTESHPRSDRESPPGVTESHPKRLSKRESKRLSEERSQDTHAGAAAPWVRGNGGGKEPVPREVVEALALHFATATGLGLPAEGTRKEVRAAERLWYGPLGEILQAAGGAQGVAEELVNEALRRLRQKDCIVKAPISVLGTALAMAGEQGVRVDRRRYVRGLGSRVMH